MFGGWRAMSLQDECDTWDFANGTVVPFKNESGDCRKLKIPDMVTKRPIQSGNMVWMLGRRHIHCFDMQTKTFSVVQGAGEDGAEQAAKIRAEVDKICED